MVRAGYSPFTGFTDHRLAWVNIKKSSVLGPYHQIVSPSIRQLKCSYPDVVNKYIQTLENALLAHDVYPQIKDLNQQINNNIDHNQANEYEYLDQTITMCMLYAEKNAAN